MSSESTSARATKIFISYSRKDKEFVKKLNDSLDSAGIDAWVDWEGIPLSSDWMAEITAAIESADAFLFVISPDSLSSKVCADELELGLKYNKKIIPILLLEPQKGQEMHPKLASTNWVYMRPEKDDYEATLPKLVETIQTDLGWIHQHTRLLQRSVEWESKNRNISYLLQGADLNDAEQWATKADADAGRSIVPLQAEYVHESRKVAVRRQRNLTIGVGIALVISIMMGVYAFIQRGVAQENERIAKANEALAVEKEAARAEQQKIAEENAKIAQQNEKIAQEEANKAQAQRNASEAYLYQTQAGKLHVSTLLAVDAYTRLPGLHEAEDVLRTNLSILPVPLKQMKLGAGITKIQTSPDRTKFVTSDEGGKACVWSAEDGSQFFCTEQKGAIYDSVFSRDGAYIATGSSEGEVKLWDANTGSLIYTFELDGVVWDLSAHPNGEWLGVGASYGISLLDMKQTKIIANIVMPSDVYKIDFGAAGRYMAIAQASGTVSVWDIQNNRSIPGPLHNGEVFDISFSPDGKWVISASSDSTARAFKIGEGTQKYSITHGDWVEYTAFSSDGSWFVTVSDDGTVRVFDTASGQEKIRMEHDSFVTKARISSDGQWIASTGYDHTARIWDSFSGAEMIQVPVKGVGSAIEFNPSTTRLIVGDDLGNLTLWDISSLHNRVALIRFTEYLHKVHFSPDGKWLLANADDKKVSLFPVDQIGQPNDGRKSLIDAKVLTEGMEVSDNAQWAAVVEADSNLPEYNRVTLSGMDGAKKFFLTHDKEHISAITFFPDSKKIATADENGLIYFWDVETGGKLDSLQTEGIILAMDISPDGKYLVIGMDEGYANQVWDLTTKQQLTTLDQLGGTNVVKFSPDGTWLATGGSEASIQLWSVEDGAFQKSEHIFHTIENLSDGAFRPDGKYLAVGDFTGNAYLIDLNKMQEIARLRHVAEVTGLSFSPDGMRLATASDKTISLWDLSSIQPIYAETITETACQHLVENLDLPTWKTLFGEAEYRLICPNLPEGNN